MGCISKICESAQCGQSKGVVLFQKKTMMRAIELTWSTPVGLPPAIEPMKSRQWLLLRLPHLTRWRRKNAGASAILWGFSRMASGSSGVGRVARRVETPPRRLRWGRHGRAWVKLLMGGDCQRRGGEGVEQIGQVGKKRGT